MTETPTPAPTPKKKRKARKAPARAAKPAATTLPKPPSEFAGMTKTDCANGCNREACVVSGRPYCAHPCKGGLQASDLNNLQALKRLQAAQKMLGIQKFD